VGEILELFKSKKTPGNMKSLSSIYFRSKNLLSQYSSVLLLLLLGKMQEQKRLIQQERAWSNQQP